MRIILLLFAFSLNVQASGIVFSCPDHKIDAVAAAMDDYLATLGIVQFVKIKDGARLRYTLNTPATDYATLNFSVLPELQIRDELVLLPAGKKRQRSLYTVSAKEIVLALLQHGRTTEFKDEACDIGALQDYIGIRQNIVAWAEQLNWIWPDGGEARWNKKYWLEGTPVKKYPLHEALNDVFFNQRKYSIGCYTAAKLVVIQGVLDYYRRIKSSPRMTKLIIERLSADPLVGIEPARLWEAEKDYDVRDADLPGKLMKIMDGIKPLNFVPGDWVYVLNTDPVSHEKTGYEGSNTLYLGRNRFSDYYNDRPHAYSYFEKLDEVYQWRNGVYSRSRDFKKIKPLQDVESLGLPPAQGGLVRPLRVTPYYFAHEALPHLYSR